MCPEHVCTGVHGTGVVVGVVGFGVVVVVVVVVDVVVISTSQNSPV